MKKLSMFCAAAMLTAPLTSHAVLISAWNFNNATVGVPSGNLGTFNTTGSVEIFDTGLETLGPASSGSAAATSVLSLGGLAGTMGGTASNNWGTFAGDLSNAVSGDVAGQALSIVGSGNNGSSFTFSLSTDGYEDLVLTYATRGTGTGYTTQDWSYSTDGVNFFSASSIGGRNVTSWSTQTVDFSSISALDDASQVYIRVTVSGAASTSGNNRFDNVQFNATAVPEPVTGLMLLGGLGSVLLIRRRR